MGEPVGGSWQAKNLLQYADASKWGTGVNPVHQFYGGPPERIYGRNLDIPEITPPALGTPGFVETESPWGYQPEDIAGLDVFTNVTEATEGVRYVQDGRPDWSEEAPEVRSNIREETKHPWGLGQNFTNILRSVVTGPGTINTLPTPYSYQTPSESVSEGWVNKPASGMDIGTPADAVPSDPSQYEIQTSMRQRYEEQNNRRAVERDTDGERESIASRVVPMKTKDYSEGERHYDMFPRQIDDVPRPFWYRTAATGRQGEMAPNEMVVISPLQRTPPPDPSMGVNEVNLPQEDFGYTSEDESWY